MAPRLSSRHAVSEHAAEHPSEDSRVAGHARPFPTRVGALTPFSLPFPQSITMFTATKAALVAAVLVGGDASVVTFDASIKGSYTAESTALYNAYTTTPENTVARAEVSSCMKYKNGVDSRGGYNSPRKSYSSCVDTATPREFGCNYRCLKTAVAHSPGSRGKYQRTMMKNFCADHFCPLNEQAVDLGLPVTDGDSGWTGGWTVPGSKGHAYDEGNKCHTSCLSGVWGNSRYNRNNVASRRKYQSKNIKAVRNFCVDSFCPLAEAVNAAAVATPVAAACDATQCTSWTCAQWCDCYDAKEDNVYAQNGCPDDGEQGCKC